MFKSALKTALLTIISCLVVLFVGLSMISSKQANRERQKQEAVRELDRKIAEEAAVEQTERAAVPPVAQANQVSNDFNPDLEIVHLRSSDREVVNHAIQQIQYYKACKAVPELVILLKESPDDYIAGISAQTIAVCKDASEYDTIVDQFLRRKAEPSMIYAIGETGTSDERVFQKLDKLISEPNPDYQEVPRIARRAKEQLEMRAPGKSH